MIFSGQFDRLHERAIKRTGLTDFGSSDYEDRLRAILLDLDINGSYSEMGVRAVLAQMVMILTSRLIAQNSLNRQPELLTKPIDKPVFIIGTPRSGTTVLHRLITNDPNIQTLPYWLAAAPVPRPPREKWENNTWYKMVDQKYIQRLKESMSDMLDLHPMRADKAEECSWIMEHSFWGATYFSTMNTPNYTKWALKADRQSFVEHYRKVLAVISNGDRRPWILKNPAHIFCLDALLTVFPDACIVQTHREPVTGLGSTSNLIWTMRKDMEPELTKKDVGALTLKTWGQGLNMMEEDRRKHNQNQFFDVHMLQTRRDPMETMKNIYAHFDMPISSDTLTSWKEELERDPNQAHSIGTYNPAEFGVDEESVANHIGSYADRYRTVSLAADL